MRYFESLAWRLLSSVRGQRVTLAIVIAWNCWNIVIYDGWWRVAFIVMTLFLIASVVFAERSRYLLREHIWNRAASSPDPVASLARSEYIQRLSPREMSVLMTWWAEHWDDPESDDAPPVVRGYYEAGQPPRGV